MRDIRGVKTTCKERLFRDWSHYDCSRPAWKDGFCKIHHPESVAKRRARSQEKYDSRREGERQIRNEVARHKVRAFLAILPPSESSDVQEYLRQAGAVLATWNFEQ